MGKVSVSVSKGSTFQTQTNSTGYGRAPQLLQASRLTWRAAWKLCKGIAPKKELILSPTGFQALSSYSMTSFWELSSKRTVSCPGVNATTVTTRSRREKEGLTLSCALKTNSTVAAAGCCRTKVQENYMPLVACLCHSIESGPIILSGRPTAVPSLRAQPQRTVFYSGANITMATNEREGRQAIFRHPKSKLKYPIQTNNTYTSLGKSPLLLKQIHKIGGNNCYTRYTDSNVRIQKTKQENMTPTKEYNNYQAIDPNGKENHKIPHKNTKILILKKFS